MVQDETKTDSKPVADNLEPYRRLVDLQKQMIELVRQHQRTKVECTELREQLLVEMANRNPRWNIRRFINRLISRPGKYLSERWHSRVENRPPANSSFLTSFGARQPNRS